MSAERLHSPTHVADPRPIGVFDSGLGGLTVLAALQKHLPNEHFLYFADTQFLPYGDRSEDFLRERGVAISQHLATQGAKAIVIACNTATAAAAEAIRAQCPLPVIALEPAVKPAVSLSKNKRIGVLATTRTLQSQRFQRLIDTHAEHDGHRVEIISQACPGLAEAIETHGPDSTQVGKLLDQYVTPLVQADVDVVVLGCTHYPWVREAIAAKFQREIAIVDTGDAVARQVAKRLHAISQLHHQKHDHDHGRNKGHTWVQTSGNALHVRQTVERLWGTPLKVEQVSV